RPVIHVPNQLIGVPPGSSATLQCNLEASPKSIQYWTKDTGEMLITNSEYLVEEELNNYYMTKMTLTILRFEKRHTGMYFCSAKNSLGETEGNIKVYEIEVATEAPTEEDMTQAGRGYTGGSEISNEVVFGAGGATPRSRNNDHSSRHHHQDSTKAQYIPQVPSQPPGDHGRRRPPGPPSSHRPTRRPTSQLPKYQWDISAAPRLLPFLLTPHLLLPLLLCLVTPLALP
ncbi:hypothetical protein Pcinc_040424, partial [Petrolisthes cinctipes]